MTTLPKAYAWLAQEPGPRLLTEFLKLYGVHEDTGPGNNETIIGWAHSIGLGAIYYNDATAWCGLAMAYAAAQAGWDHAPRGNALGARNWLAWGTAQDTPMLADVLVFWREKKTGFKGHVGIYVGEDPDCFHVLAGNQGDMVSIKRLPRDRLLGARRCPWRVNQPANVRRVVLTAGGAVSGNES